MEKIHTARTPLEANLIQGFLEAAGIATEVRGEALFATVQTAALLPEARPSVWVLDPAQVLRARDLVDRYSRGEALAPPSAPSWSCPACGECHEPQFTSCWKCGAARA